MTQEEKQLLLKDLCARLPYGVKILDIPANVVGDLFLVSTTDTVEYETNDDMGTQTLYNIKPYLRPMSSMTSKEWMEYCDACLEDDMSWTWARAGKEFKFFPITHREEFLNTHHFDYRGLIPMGLALEAPEDMYKTE